MQILQYQITVLSAQLVRWEKMRYCFLKETDVSFHLQITRGSHNLLNKGWLRRECVYTTPTVNEMRNRILIKEM